MLSPSALPDGFSSAGYCHSLIRRFNPGRNRSPTKRLLQFRQSDAGGGESGYPERVVNGSSTVLSAIWLKLARPGRPPMGTVPLWRQWLIIAQCVLVSPIIVVAVAIASCWLLIRRLWPGREVGPVPGRRAGPAPRGEGLSRRSPNRPLG